MYNDIYNEVLELKYKYNSILKESKYFKNIIKKIINMKMKKLLLKIKDKFYHFYISSSDIIDFCLFLEKTKNDNINTNPKILSFSNINGKCSLSIKLYSELLITVTAVINNTEIILDISDKNLDTYNISYSDKIDNIEINTIIKNTINNYMYQYLIL